jgi:SAM-dependent methyltransferase
MPSAVPPSQPKSALEPQEWMSGFQPFDTGSHRSFDTSVPHPARVYAYWLGGKDCYEADRKAAEAVIEHRPQVVASARANRLFLARVVRYLAADCGIRQFLDIGAGLPAVDNTHEVAQQVDPGARVVYADNDPLVLTHARALLTSTPPGSCDYIDADLRDTDIIVAHAAGTLDLAQPVAVLLLAVLHFIPDGDDPAAIVARLASALAPGSYIALSHLTADFAPEQVVAAATAYNTQASTPVTPRTHAQVSGLFGGLPLVAPGVVPVTQWRPTVMGLPHRMTADVYAGAARIGQGRR